MCVSLFTLVCGSGRVCLSYRDPTHHRLFSYHTFDYITDDCFYGLPNFNIVSRSLNFTRLAFPKLNYIFNPLINISPTLSSAFSAGGCLVPNASAPCSR